MGQHIKASVSELVAIVVDFYMENEYNYIKSLAKEGQRPYKKVKTVDDEIAFINVNDLGVKFSDEEIRIAAEITFRKTKEIEDELYNKYNK